MEKRCSECRGIKDIREFSQHRGTLRGKCKACDNRQRQYNREKKRLSLLHEISGGDNCCHSCGEDDVDVLQIHHLNFNGSEDRSGVNPDKKYELQVVCASCHLKIHKIQSRRVTHEAHFITNSNTTTNRSSIYADRPKNQ